MFKKPCPHLFSLGGVKMAVLVIVELHSHFITPCGLLAATKFNGVLGFFTFGCIQFPIPIGVKSL